MEKWAKIIEDHYCELIDTMRIAAKDILGSDGGSYRIVELNDDGSICMYWGSGTIISAEVMDGTAIVVARYKASDDPEADSVWADEHDYAADLDILIMKFEEAI